MKATPAVLFLDRDNSTRSQLAEALLRHHGRGRFHCYSAGLEPAQLSPLVLQTLAEIGVDSSGLHPKSVSELLAKVSIEWAILIRARGEAGSPRIYPFATKTLQWECPDPAASFGTDEERLTAFRNARDLLGESILQWLRESMPRAA